MQFIKTFNNNDTQIHWNSHLVINIFVLGKIFENFPHKNALRIYCV